MGFPSLSELVTEYDRALAYTDDLVHGLSDEQVRWRPHEDSSAIGWHLGHQPAVAHFMIRNLTAAEPRIEPELELLMDSATAESQRGAVPPVAALRAYRAEVADRVRFRIGQIDDGYVGAPTQLRHIAATLMVSVINHEYQHDKWIGEVRVEAHGLDLPSTPSSPHLVELDGYTVIGAT